MHDLVFVTKSGNPVEPRNLARSFDRITNRAKPYPAPRFAPHNCHAA
jgi:hypothetical protein